MEYKFKINDFEGPLDLLLHLVKESKMDIMNIEIVKLTDQYVKFIESMANLNLNIASSYLTMAAELIHLKSKYLLPQVEKDEEEDTYEEEKEKLQNRLVEYERYKSLTNEFKELETKRKEVYTKIPSNINEYRNKEIKLDSDVSLNDLVNAFQKFLDRKKALEPINTKITRKEISVDERIVSIRSLLKERKRVEFTELFEELTKSYVIATFLAVLEMAKFHELKLVQENNFDKIYCEVS